MKIQNKTRNVWIIAATAMVSVILTIPPAHAALAFTELFESADVSGTSTLQYGATYDNNTVPSGGNWVGATQGFGASRRGLINKTFSDYTAPAGNEQAYYFGYTNSGLTSGLGVIGTLVAYDTYVISYDVAQPVSEIGNNTPLTTKFVAFNSGAARNDVRNNTGTTVLASQGSTITNNDIGGASKSFNVTTPAGNAGLGNDVAIRFLGNSRNPIVDNVVINRYGSGTVTWTGAINNDGANAGNWTGGTGTGGAPDRNDNITINSGTITDPGGFTGEGDTTYFGFTGALNLNAGTLTGFIGGNGNNELEAGTLTVGDGAGGAAVYNDGGNGLEVIGGLATVNSDGTVNITGSGEFQDGEFRVTGGTVSVATFVGNDAGNGLFSIDGGDGVVNVTSFESNGNGDENNVLQYTLNGDDGFSTFNVANDWGTGNSSAAQFAATWTIDLTAVSGLTENDFTDLTLMSGLATFGTDLADLLTITAWDAAGDPFTFTNVPDGQLLYIESGSLLQPYLVEFTSTSFNLNLLTVVVPEPSTLLMATLGLFSLGFIGWRRRRR